MTRIPKAVKSEVLDMARYVHAATNGSRSVSYVYQYIMGDIRHGRVDIEPYFHEGFTYYPGIMSAADFFIPGHKEHPWDVFQEILYYGRKLKDSKEYRDSLAWMIKNHPDYLVKEIVSWEAKNRHAKNTHNRIHDLVLRARRWRVVGTRAATVLNRVASISALVYRQRLEKSIDAAWKTAKKMGRVYVYHIVRRVTPEYAAFLSDKTNSTEVAVSVKTRPWGGCSYPVVLGRGPIEQYYPTDIWSYLTDKGQRLPSRLAEDVDNDGGTDHDEAFVKVGNTRWCAVLYCKEDGTPYKDCARLANLLQVPVWETESDDLYDYDMDPDRLIRVMDQREDEFIEYWDQAQEKLLAMNPAPFKNLWHTPLKPRRRA